MSALNFDTIEIGSRTYKVIGFYRPPKRNNKGQLGYDKEREDLIEVQDALTKERVVMNYPFEVYRSMTHFRALKDGVEVTDVKVVF